MPNWKSNEVQITGSYDEIARFRIAHISKDSNGEDMLDLHSIIPMPSELLDTESGGYLDSFVWALGGELWAEQSLVRKLGMRSAAKTPLDLKWVRDLGIATREELLRWAEMERPNELDSARRAIEIERSTGYRNWYDWQTHNWGCTLDWCEILLLSDDKIAFRVDTPWPTPSPILHKLVELYPSLTFSCRFMQDDHIEDVETYTA